VRILRARDRHEPLAVAPPPEGAAPVRPRSGDGNAKWV
jgi:hypothetical protein